MHRAGALGLVCLVAAFAGGDAASQPASGCPTDFQGECVISVDTAVDLITVSGFTPSSRVDFEIYQSAGGPLLFAATRQTGPLGFHALTWNAQENPGHGLDLVGGNYVVATDVATATMKTLVISPLAISRVDVGADSVSGTAGSGERVFAQAGETQPPVLVAVDADAVGLWTANFAAQGQDIGLGTSVRSAVYDQDWDATTASPRGCPTHHALECSIIGSIEGDRISLFSFSRSSNVRFEVFDAPGGRRIYGPVTKKTVSLPTPPFLGFYHLDFGVQPGPDLVPGTYIRVTDVATGAVKTVELISLSIDRVDPVADVVEGRAPPGTTVELSAMDRFLGERVVADSAGNWRVDLAAKGFDATPQDWFLIHARDVDWDETQDDLGAPLSDCKPDANTICGSAGEDTLRAAGVASRALARARGLEVKAGPRDDTVLLRLRRSTGRVTVALGTGSDGLVLNPGARRLLVAPTRVTVNGGIGDDTVVLPAHAGSFRVSFAGGAGADRVVTRKFGGRGASTGRYVLAGGGGNDRLVAGDAADLLSGGAGKDVLIGGRGADTLIGGPGRDVCVAGAGDTTRSCEVVRR